MTKTPTIGFAGLTHLGLNSALAAAIKGFDVVGWDESETLIECLVNDNIPINEPEFDKHFGRVKEQFRFSASLEVLGVCDVVYFSVDVPTDDQGASNLAPISALLEQVVAVIREDCVFVILSQVPPGFTATMRDRFRLLYYQVETLIFGRAVERATKPERFIIGTPEPRSDLPLNYRTYLESFDCPILPMRYESAELCKIAINCFLVASVTTTNALSGICEKIGADWEEIAPALRLDARIGPNAYLKPGLGISGGNLERDLRNVVEMATEHDVDAGPIEEYRRFSEASKAWVFDELQTVFGNALGGKTIGVLGLAYKENTHSTKNSPALKLIENLGDCTLRVYDPVVPSSAAAGVEGFGDPISCCSECDAVCIMTPWDEFRAIEPTSLAKNMSGNLVIDPYDLLDSQALASVGLMHHVRGRPPN